MSQLHRSWLTALVLCLLALPSLLAARDTCNEVDQAAALLAFYNAAGGPSWTPTCQVGWGDNNIDCPYQIRDYLGHVTGTVTMPSYCCWGNGTGQVGCCSQAECNPFVTLVDGTDCDCAFGLVTGLGMNGCNLNISLASALTILEPLACSLKILFARSSPGLTGEEGGGL